MMETNELLKQGDIAFQANLYSSNNATRRWLHTRRRDWVMNAVDRVLSNQQEWPATLEIGVGSGLYTRRLAERSCLVHAVDINMSFLDRVGTIPGVKVHCQDASRGLPVDGINLAICSEVIEHVPPSRSLHLLKSIYASLQPGGVLILTTPQSYSTMELAARLLRFPIMMSLARRIYGHVDDLGHINRLSSKELKTQVASVGFEIVLSETLALYIPLLAEFGGDPAKRFAERLESFFMKRRSLRWLLWTQCYVLRKP